MNQGISILSRFIEPKRQHALKRELFSNRDLFKLTAPIIAEQLLVLLVGIADTLMVSYAGASAVSGVSLVNQLNSVFVLVFSALAAGGSVVISQYIGSEDRQGGLDTAGQLLMVTSLISLALMAAVLLFGNALFGALFGEVASSVHDDGMTYLIITAYSLLSLGVYNACAGLFRSLGKTKEVMYVSFASNAINVAGNAVGIFALHAGVAGVAWPSVIARTFSAIALVSLASSKRNALYLRARSIFAWKGQMLVRILRIAIPGGVENGLFQLTKVALSAIVAMFGTVQIAAYGVAQSIWSLAALFAIAMGPAFITVVGRYMGARDIKGARYYMVKLLKITYGCGTTWNVIVLALTPALLMLFDLTEETAYLVIALVVIHNVFNVLFAPLAFSLASGLRAAGDVKFNLLSSLLTSIVVRASLSILFAIVLNMGVIGIAFAMVCDWGIKGLMVALRYKGNRWEQIEVI